MEDYDLERSQKPLQHKIPQGLQPLNIGQKLQNWNLTKIILASKDTLKSLFSKKMTIQDEV